MPRTSVGKRSVILIAFFFFFLTTLQIMVIFGQRGGETFFTNLLLAIPGLLAAASAVLAFFIGILAIIKRKERSPLVFIAVLVGVFVFIFSLGEILFPH